MGRGLLRFSDVRAEELELIEKRRERIQKRISGDEKGDRISISAGSNMVGLALSGGGIRSAATNLGILQGLSKARVLEFVDLLSTVSGGGYVGACLSSLLSLNKTRTHGVGTDPYAFSGKTEDHAAFTTRWDSFPFRDHPVGESGTATPESLFTGRDQMGHIRSMASYLVPRDLLFCSDVLKALGATVITTLVPLFCTLLILTTLTLFYMALSAPLVHDLVEHKTPPLTTLTFYYMAFSPPLGHDLFESVGMGTQTREDRSPGEQIGKAGDPKHSPPPKIAEAEGQHPEKTVWGLTKAEFAGFIPLAQREGWIQFWLGFGFIFWFCVSFSFTDSPITKGGDISEAEAGMRETTILFSSILIAHLILLTLSSSLLLAGTSCGGAGLLLPAAYSLSAFLGTCAAFIAMAFRKDKLYWTLENRSQAQIMAGVCLWALAGTLALGLLHSLILISHSVWTPVLLGSNIAGLKGWPLIKKWIMHEGSQAKSALAEKLERWVVGLLVPAFILLTVAFTGSLINHHFLDAAWPAPGIANKCIAVGFGLTAVILVLSFLVNLNRLTPHYFYRDRLAEAFLRTLRRREMYASGETVTLLRDASQMPLTALHGLEPQDKKEKVCAARGPYLLVNATLNLTATRDLKGFQRKADVFTFSHCFSGSERTGYIRTSMYDDEKLELSRVMTISGAAVTSIRGSMGTMASSFACGIFGVRLGYWMANPQHLSQSDHFSRHRFWPWWFMLELFNYSHERSKLVYLSDGGHSGDNLGILPLLRRRTRLIIASDAEQDKDYLFNSLNSSLRQAYVDEGIKVDIDLSAFEGEEKKSHHAIGRILYPDRPWQKSLLIVIKNCLTADVKLAPVKNYKKKSPDFPHETTGDQFFTEEQFEAYRALGRYSAEGIFSDWYPRTHPPDPWKALFEHLSRQKTSHRWDDVIHAIYETDQGCFDSWEGFKKTIEGYFSQEDPHLNMETEAETRDLREVRELLREKKDFLGLLDKHGFVPHTLPELRKTSSSARITRLPDRGYR